MEDVIKFRAIVQRKVKDSENFKMFGVMPTEKNDKLQFNKYGNISINGDIHDLSLDMEYEFTVKPNKYGYEVIKAVRDKPTNKTQTIKFLMEVITQKQAKALLDAYPNIVQLIVDNKLDGIDLNSIKGIKEKTFEVIKRKVIESFPLMDFINEYSKYEISISIARKMYDTFTSIESMREKMNKDPYSTLCLIGGIGFAKADKMILKSEDGTDLLNSLSRMKSCVKYILKENESNGNTWISLSELTKKCNELAPESIDFLLESLKDEEIHIDIKNKRIAFLETYKTELFIAKTLVKMLKVHKPLLVDPSKYYRVDGFELGEDQKKIVSQFCNSVLGLLVGSAGSGKSMSTQAIINLCDDIGLTYMLMTPTGKSAIVLSNFTKKDAGTIHRKLGYNPSKGWTYNKDNKIRADVVIVDENGMTDIGLMKHLLEAIDINKTRLLFVQDDAQLPSVSCGNCAYDFINSGIIPTTRLNQIFRYGEGGLLQIATKIRKGEKFIDNDCDEVTVFGTNKDYSFIPSDDDSISSYVVAIYQQLLNQGNSSDDIMVLSANNVGKNGTIELNSILQEKFNPNEEGKTWIKYGDTVYRLKDIVMQNANNYKAINEFWEEDITITNGEIGEIIKIEWNKVYIKFPRDILVYDKEDLKQIQLAYSISTYKSQGGSVKNVILVSPVSQKWNSNKNLLYVGATRARNKCFHIGLPSTINYALKKSAELQRNTFCKDLLIKLYNE